MGGTILTTVDGVEVTVEHVAAIRREATAAGRLRQHAGKIPARFETEEGIGPASADPALASRLLPRTCVAHGGRCGCGAKSGQSAAAKAPAAAAVFQPPAVTAQQISAEESKLRRVEESIRVFVRVADPKYRQVVPMRFFNLTLTTPEADAYSAPFLEEKSPRADVARTLIRMVSISARISTELEELKRSQKMSSAVEAARRFGRRIARHGQHNDRGCGQRGQGGRAKRCRTQPPGRFMNPCRSCATMLMWP